MKNCGSAFRRFLGMVFSIGLLGCSTIAGGNVGANPIVGAWLVKEAGAPFPYHMYVFNADGTMQQANPDAGDARSSDSDGKGVWIADGRKIKGKWLEVTADRVSRQFIGRGELSFDIVADGNRSSGPSVFRFYGVDVKLVEGPINTSLSAERVTLP